MASNITYAEALEKLNAVYLNDTDGALYSQDGRYFALTEAVRDVVKKAALHEPSQLYGTDYEIPSYVSTTVMYNLPSDFWFAKRLKVQYSTSPVTYDSIPNVGASDDNGQVGWFIKGSQIGVRLGTTTGTPYLEYIARATTATSSGTAIPVSDDWADLAVLKAAIILKNGRQLDTSVLRAEFNSKLEDLQLLGARRELGDEGNITTSPYSDDRY
jgi:hypothetical protein